MPSPIAAASVKSKRDNADVPSSSQGPLTLHATRSSSKAAGVRPKKDDYYSTSLDLHTISIGTARSSLAGRLAELSKENENEFVDRLVSEEENQAIANIQTRSSPIQLNPLWTIIGSTLLLFLSSYLISSPSAAAFVWNDLCKASQSALSVLVLPWMWIRPTSMAATDVMTYLQVFGKLSLAQYLWEHILPVSLETLRKMLVTEGWKRFWTAAFNQLNSYIQVRKESGGQATGSVTARAPAWLVESHSFLCGAIERGTKKIFQSTLQTHLQESMVSGFQVAVGAIREHL
jgi:hypothetical protein